MIDDFCSGKLEVQGQNLDYITNAVTDIDNKMRQTTANYMCTSDCPCPTSASYGNWLLKWSNETQLNVNNRTNMNKPLPYVQIYTVIPGGTTKTYTKFWDCYIALKNLNQYSTYSSLSSNSKWQDVSEDMQTLISNMEADLGCSGICTPGAFFFFSDLSVGPPLKNCIEGIKDTFKNKVLAVGVILVFTFLLTFIAWIINFSICCNCGKNKD
jgi:hypothetical protein